MLPNDGFDGIRILSLVFFLATFIIVSKAWGHFPRFHAQFFLVLVYLVLGIVYYSIYLLTRVIFIPWVTLTLANQVGAALRFWDASTWFVVALLYIIGSRGKKHEHR